MSEPWIGVSCDVHVPAQKAEAWEFALDHRYAKAIQDAGGHPVVLPIMGEQDLVPRYLARLDGVVIVGGDDVDPRLYGEKTKAGTGKIFPPRQRFECWLYAEARARGLPIFAICYGMQLINVLEGGTLYQDIKRDARSGLNHRNRRNPKHRVGIVPHSRLARVLGRRSVEVHSEHHQAIRRLAPGFRAAALAPDGIVEAIECDDECLLAVQWHPERSLRSLATRQLFRWFVERCSGSGSRSRPR